MFFQIYADKEEYKRAQETLQKKGKKERYPSPIPDKKLENKAPVKAQSKLMISHGDDGYDLDEEEDMMLTAIEESKKSAYLEEQKRNFPSQPHDEVYLQED